METKGVTHVKLVQNRMDCVLAHSVCAFVGSALLLVCMVLFIGT